MKEWFYIAYYDANSQYSEWEVAHKVSAHLRDHMDNYIKFSGTVKGGKAFKINRLSGKPTFTRPIVETGLPWSE